MIYIGNQRSMSNFIKGTEIDLKDTYRNMIKFYKEMNDDNIEYIYDYIEELHMLFLQYNNFKQALDKGDICSYCKNSCWEEIDNSQCIDMEDLMNRQKE